jgi:hypothetical protein
MLKQLFSKLSWRVTLSIALLILVALLGCNTPGPVPIVSPVTTSTVQAIARANATSTPGTASATPTRPRATSTMFLSLLVSPTPILTSAVTSKWIEYWDRRYGYGLAIPCHWTVYPTPSEGKAATLTMMSYDENFARANTDKGEWKGTQWPAGALKIDLTVFEGIAPGDSLADAVRQNLDNEFSAIESVQEKALGSRMIVSAVLARRNDPSNKSQVIAFRISSDKVLITSVLPANAWESSDVKGVLNSVAFSRQEKIVMPSTSPATLLAPVPNWCVGK